MSKVHVTSKGTELPILNLRGKDYLEVKHRIVWFREERPEWSIETEFRSLTDNAACAKATIKDQSGRIITTSHKTETKSGFPDFAEKAETGAIGRALALCGYGTQFCGDELDEGDRIVDSPNEPRGPKKSQQVAARISESIIEDDLFGDDYSLGDYVVKFGKKLKGMALKDIDPDELFNYLNWVILERNKSQKEPHPDVAKFIEKASEYLKEIKHNDQI